jgi:O-antigen/teichoic acid export membrane protein
MHDVWLKVAHTSGAKLYSLGLSFVTLVITAHWLGPEGRGQLAVVTTWSGLFFTFGYFSLGQVAIHRATLLRDQPWLGRTLVSLGMVTCVLTIVGWIVAAGLYRLSGGAVFNQLAGPILAIGFLTLPFLLWEHYGSSLLIAVDRLSVYNNAQIVARSLGVLLLIAMLKMGGQVFEALVANLTVQIMMAVACLPDLLGLARGQPLRPVWPTMRSLLSGGLNLHANAIGTFLIMSTDVLIINYYRGPAETGYYQLAVQLMSGLLIIPQAVSTVVYSHVAQYGPDMAWAFQRRLLLWLTLGMIVLATLAFISSSWLIPIIAGSEFAPAVIPFRWLLLALIGMTFSIVMAAQWIGRGLFWQVSALTVSIGLLNLGASLLLVPHYGMYGSIWGTLITYVVSIIINGGMVLSCEKRLNDLLARNKMRISGQSN